MALTYSSQFSLNKLKQNLFTRENVFNQRVQEVIKDGADEIMKKSQSNAPVDTHNLEEAHRIVPGETRKGYTKLSVEVSGEGTGSDRPRDVSSYAKEMHDNYENYHMGPKSVAKLDAGNEVGGRFLERAVEEKKPEIIAKAKKAAKDSF
jgi:hypothetical protein